MCERLGHDVGEASPDFSYQSYLEAQKVLWAAFMRHEIDSVATVVRRTPGPENLLPTTWDLYRQGEAVSAAQLLVALETYAKTTRDVGRFFETWEILITPTTTILPPLHGTFDPAAEGVDIFDQLAPHETFTSIFNATGQPAVSLPLFQTETDLPIGIQFCARFGDEPSLLGLAAQLEEAVPWRERRPSVHVSEC